MALLTEYEYQNILLPACYVRAHVLSIVQGKITGLVEYFPSAELRLKNVCIHTEIINVADDEDVIDKISLLYNKIKGMGHFCNPLDV